MSPTEAIIVAALTAMMLTFGLEALSPEADAVVGELRSIARVQDRQWQIVSEIVGYEVRPEPLAIN